MTTPSHTSDSEMLAQFSQMYRTVVDAFMDQVGMHRGQGMLLCTVVKQEGMTQSELGDLLAVQGATITNMLQRLEESNLIIRRRDPEDNRLVRVYATDEGREKELSIIQQLRQLEEAILKGFSEEDRQVLRRLIWQMIGNMHEAS